jgi:hypothetical protein
VRPAPAISQSLPGSPRAAIVPDWIEARSSWTARLQRMTQTAGLGAMLVDRGAATSGLEAPAARSTGYLSQTEAKRSATVWVFREVVSDDK